MRKFGKILLAFLMISVLCFTSNAYALYSLGSEGSVNPGEVVASKSAKVVEGGDGRDVDITIGVDGNAFNQTMTQQREVVLVLDDSGSMDEYIRGTRTKKIDALKEATKELINTLLPEGGSNKTKVGIVYYGTDVKGSCALTSDKTTLINCLNGMNANGGTNVQAGLSEANSLFSGAEASRSVILLSDGEPTFYTDPVYGVVGNGNSDDVACLEYSIWSCSKEGIRPSEAALNEVKNIDATIYTVGFDINRGSNAETFLKNVSGEENYFLATSFEDLKLAFKDIVSKIDVIATEVTVVDVVPKTFDINEEYFINTFGNAQTMEDGSVKYGDKVIVKANEDGTKTVTWLIGNLKADEDNSLTFRIRAKDDYYGNMFTNDSATVTGYAVDGNPFYIESNEINISLENPTVVIPAVTKDDRYSVNQGETLTVNKDLGVRANDHKSIKNDKDAKVVDEVVVVTGVSKGTLKVNADGSFVYVAPKDYYGDVEFTYYIKTVVEVDGKKTEVISNASKAVITINRISTNYVVHHYINGTTTKLADDEVGTGYVYETISANAKSFNNYKLVGTENVKVITLSDGTNEIIFYYELKQAGNIIVHYVVEGTNEKLSNDVILSGKVTEGYTTEAKNFKNYELVRVEGNTTGEFSLDGGEVTYFYRLKQGGKVVVHYYEFGTTNSLSESIILNGKVTEKYNSEAMDIANWELVAVPSNKSGEFTLEDQEVIYYYKKVMGKVIVKYVDEDGKALYNDVTLEGQVSSKYETEELVIEGYELSKVEGEREGLFSDGEVVVTYVYKVKAPVTEEVEDTINTGITGKRSSLLMLVISLSLTTLLISLRKRFN